MSPVRSTFQILAASVLFLLLGVWLSPERLVSVGLMKTSLTSHIELVRETMLLEVLIAKHGLLALGVILLILGVFWSTISASSTYRRFVAWDMNPPAVYEKQLLTVWNRSFWVLMVMFVLSALYLKYGNAWFSPETLIWINMEDGVIETASATFMFLAGVVSLVVAVRMRGRMLPRTLMHTFLALLFVMMCGEEISWGQRYFGFETPESMKPLNVQNEFNLHNMFGYVFDHLFILFFFLWGCVVPLLHNQSIVFRQIFRMIGLPIPSVGLAIGMLIITLLQGSVVYKFTDGVFGLRIPELREMLSSVAFALLMAESYCGLIGSDQSSAV